MILGADPPTRAGACRKAVAKAAQTIRRSRGGSAIWSSWTLHAFSWATVTGGLVLAEPVRRRRSPHSVAHCREIDLCGLGGMTGVAQRCHKVAEAMVSRWDLKPVVVAAKGM